MTKAAAATLAMIFGVTLGCHFAGESETRDISARRVKASEFVLVDENGQPTARFVTSAGDTRLQFLARDNSTALEVGVSNFDHGRYIRFMEPGGNVVMALNTPTDAAATTLYLGDKNWTPVLCWRIPGRCSGTRIRR